MADDAHPEARDPELAAWLAVDPLDDVTRRRLVTTALRDGDDVSATAPSRAWRWIAAAAALVVLLAGGLAVLTANGGNDQHQATRAPRSLDTKSAAPASPAGAPANVGDFGNLDRTANLDRLRAALADPGGASGSAPPAASGAESFAGAAAGNDTSSRSGSCRERLPHGTVLAEGTGTLDGRATVVVLTRLADGSPSFDAVLADPCEVRHLP